MLKPDEQCSNQERIQKLVAESILEQQQMDSDEYGDESPTATPQGFNAFMEDGDEEHVVYR